MRKITDTLLADKDDLVQKGLGWLLRESAKADAKLTMPLLMSIKDRSQRLVLRTACETLSSSDRKKVLGRQFVVRSS